MFGKIKYYEVKDNVVSIEFEHGQATVTVVTPSIINFFSPISSERRPSKAIENLQPAPGEIKTDFAGGQVLVYTSQLKAVVADNFIVDIYDLTGNLLCADYRGEDRPFVRRGTGNDLDIAAEEGHKFEAEQAAQKIRVLKQLQPDSYFYGLGDKTGHLNKRGYHYKMWNTDNPEPHVESFESLYKSIPFFIALTKKTAYGIFFDNSYKTFFDFGKENSQYYSFSAVDGNLDYYFIYGPSAKEVVGGYTFLTGRTPLPQLWTLGYQQSRWSYAPEKRLEEIADDFREKGIPCDVLYLDIDYMDGYRVFTWDDKKFPDHEQMLKRLKDKGFKVVTIIDPGVKKDQGYAIYDQGVKNHYFATDKDGLPYVNRVWPGDALYPDFANQPVRKWWAENQKILVDHGVAGVWNDMNEPASFNGPLPDDVQFNNDGRLTDHREIHNVYGHYMSKATYEGIKAATNKRPFVITRAAYAGTQKYSTVWTGDNQSLWEHLRMSLPMLMNLGLSGLAFSGTDVGGFGFDATAELLSRWVQVGAFTALFRNHSSVFTRDQEPWAFDPQTESINRKYIRLRYRLLPYFYDIMHAEESSGLAMIRPLLLDYQDDEAVYEINDEFMSGSNLLVAPVVAQGQKARTVYLPKGNRWIDYWTQEVFQGGQYIVKQAPLDTCPIYVKEGSTIPLYPVQNYVGEKQITELTLDIYPLTSDGQSLYEHYRDDGESFDYRDGVYNLYNFRQTRKGDQLTIQISEPTAQYAQQYDHFQFVIHAKQVMDLKIDGQTGDMAQSEGAVTVTVPSRAREVSLHLA
ncbi:glycoside hydrolase family 31 protein [Oenococcus sp.]|uniref:glycoside hydrolase family 31 protein n=1 Tax=Oenococcus sp. TaxID=1979414 RepID=UPI0039ECA9F7